MIEIRRITEENAADLNLKNEPFTMPGRFIPELKDGMWSYYTELFETPETMIFPDENYDFDDFSKVHVNFAAYEDGVCQGMAMFLNYPKALYQYLYLVDLKVCQKARRKGLGRALIEAGLEEANKLGYRGIYTIAQDNNLNACLFYLSTGFEIGGFNNRVYTGTSQEGKADIYFYTK